MKINGFNRQRRLNAAQRFFIWLSGSSAELLKQTPQWEQIKHQAVGASVLVPIAFGFAASFYTTASLTDGWILPTLVGIFWACAIAITDRVLLASYRKHRSQWIQAGVRMTIAGLMGIVVAHPVIFWVFRDSLTHQIDGWRNAEVTAVKQNATEEVSTLREEKEKQLKNLNDQLKDLQAKRDGVEKDAAAKNIELSEYMRDYRAETDGRRNSRVVGRGPIAQDIEDRLIKPTQARITVLDAKLAGINDQIKTANGKASILNKALAEDEDIASVRKKRDAVIKRTETRSWSDLIAQMTALHELEEKHRFVANAKWTLLSLFFLLDTLALLSKLLCPRGPYDDLVERDLFESSEDLASHNANYPDVAACKFEERMRDEIQRLAVEQAMNEALAPLRGATRLTAEISEQTAEVFELIDESRRMLNDEASQAEKLAVEEHADALADTARRAGLAAIHKYNQFIARDFPGAEADFGPQNGRREGYES